MDTKTHDNTGLTHWFAIKTRHDFRAEEVLSAQCEEVFFPKEKTVCSTGKNRVRAVIPHVLFVRTTSDRISSLERECNRPAVDRVPFWIYRYPNDNAIQIIPQQSIDLLKLLTADDTSRCHIYTAKEFHPNERVRITGGLYKGYEGFVKRVKKNKHVIVCIEGVCMIMLPFIHPDLLEKL